MGGNLVYVIAKDGNDDMLYFTVYDVSQDKDMKIAWSSFGYHELVHEDRSGWKECDSGERFEVLTFYGEG